MSKKVLVVCGGGQRRAELLGFMGVLALNTQLAEATKHINDYRDAVGLPAVDPVKVAEALQQNMRATANGIAEGLQVVKYQLTEGANND